MNLEEEFALTYDERARLETAPFRGTDEQGWSVFAWEVHEQVIAAYANGEITLHRALAAVRSCALGCSLKYRIMLLALTARRALDVTPKEWSGRRPQHPEWVRRSAVSLVRLLRQNNPDEPITPNEINGWSTPILVEVIASLLALGLCETITPRTLYGWWKQFNSTSTA